jgi:hypothetical protein
VSRPRSAWTLAAALTAGLATAHAAVPVIDDVRFEYAYQLGEDASIRGVSDRWSTTGFDRHEVFDLAPDTMNHSRWGIAWYRSYGELTPAVGSLVYGIGLADDRVEMDQESFSLDGDTWLADGFVGWAWALTPNWHIEQGAILGGGAATWEWRSSLQAYHDWNSRSTSFAWEYGFRVGTAYTFPRGWQVALDLRHLVTRSRGYFSETVRINGGAGADTQSYEPEIEVRGMGATLSVGYRF